MSSKLYESGVGIEYAPWYLAGSPVASLPCSPPPGRTDAAAPDEARVQQAYEQGLAAGEAAAANRAAERLNPTLANLSSIAQELAGMRNSIRLEAEKSAVELAVAIARRVLHRELVTDPEAIFALVRHASERISARELHRLRVAPADHAVLQEHRGRLNLPPAIELVPDPQLRPGSAIFETSRGELDASVDTQLDEIQRGLTDLLRKRMR